MPASKDIAKLSTRVTFLQEQSLPDGYGGYKVSTTEALNTWAEKKPVRDNNQLHTNAGVTALNKDAVFRIRHRAAFSPTKSMKLKNGTDTYTIAGIVPQEEVTGPTRYLNILCKRLD